MPWNLCFMFVHIFVLLLPVPKPTTKEIGPCQGLCAYELTRWQDRLIDKVMIHLNSPICTSASVTINQQEPTGKINVIYALACPGQGQIQIDCLGTLQLL